MTVFPLLISSNIFSWFLIKFVKFVGVVVLGDFNARYDSTNPSGRNSDVGEKII